MGDAVWSRGAPFHLHQGNADNAQRVSRRTVHHRVGRSIARLVTRHGTRPSGRYRRGSDRYVLPWSALTSHTPAQGDIASPFDGCYGAF